LDPISLSYSHYFLRFLRLQIVFDLSDNHRGPPQTPIINPVGFEKRRINLKKKWYFQEQEPYKHVGTIQIKRLISFKLEVPKKNLL